MVYDSIPPAAAKSAILTKMPSHLESFSDSTLMIDAPSPAETLTERVFHRLREDIVSGALVASAKLRVQELGQRYGVGASPLREALSRLTADRLVVTESNRGFRVAAMSMADFHDVTDNRIRIEGLAVEQSVAAGDDAWEGRLIADYHQLRKLEDTYKPTSKLNDPVFEWERRHRNFHHALVAACPSRWLLHFDRLLVLQFDRYRRLAQLDARTALAGRKQERQLVDAALARDAAGARAILVRHIEDSATIIEGFLRKRWDSRQGNGHRAKSKRSKRN